MIICCEFLLCLREEAQRCLFKKDTTKGLEEAGILVQVALTFCVESGKQSKGVLMSSP